MNVAAIEKSGATMLTLRNGRMELGVLPTCGGSLCRFCIDREGARVHLFRPAPPSPSADPPVLAMSCFPLVPYSGRIRQARLRFRARDYVLPPSVTGEANALHGEGWLRPWRVDDSTENSARLSLRGDGRHWPFAYAARQQFWLAGDRMIAEISVTNEGMQPMPAGIGLHPCFMATPRASMTMRAEQVWLVGQDNLFDRVAPIPAGWDFSAGRQIVGTNLVNGFSGWDGRVVLEWPEWRARLTMVADAGLRHLVVYTPPDADHFCVEPVSHSVDAFNLAEQGVPGTGTVVLGPGETLHGRVKFKPELDLP